MDSAVVNCGSQCLEKQMYKICMSMILVFEQAIIAVIAAVKN